MPAVEVAIWAVCPLYKKPVGFAVYAGSIAFASAARDWAEATAAFASSRETFSASSAVGGPFSHEAPVGDAT